ncbi:DUF421 domain-containing protein [Streptococcus sanguinis]|uniref:DUF421 domain-containing protein n=1 Tax=Streptococcus sanguinis TaxID=1305 RepID=A0A7Y0VBD7_STRSA|nr:DUF421 domain-containing protein [Streptococcus sanguinis]
MEQNGQIIIVQAGEENPKYPLITDGVVQIDILESIDKQKSGWWRDWLKMDTPIFRISSSQSMKVAT